MGRETELTRSEIVLSVSTVRGLTCFDRIAGVVRHFAENLPEVRLEHPRDTSGGQGDLPSNGVPAGKADRGPGAICLLGSMRHQFGLCGLIFLEVSDRPFELVAASRIAESDYMAAVHGQ